MSKRYLFAAVIISACAVYAADRTATLMPGLTAEYYQDPIEWGGNWPITESVPKVDPKAWTFKEFGYSRVEPLVNHLFVKQGWFSVRWTGLLDVPAKVVPVEGQNAVSGLININPANADSHDFLLTLADGRTIGRADLKRRLAGYEGPATSVFLKAKGASRAQSLVVDGVPYYLKTPEAVEIVSTSMNVRLYNDDASKAGKPMGQWWISISATNAQVFTSGGKKEKGQDNGNGDRYTFELLADDGCRLLVDGKALIDDWRPCWEGSPDAVRRSEAVHLEPGKHSIVIEYFQGQSLAEGDSDPIKLYWSSIDAGLARQIIAPEYFSHNAGGRADRK